MKKVPEVSTYISIQIWSISQYQKQISEEESKFIRLSDKDFKIIKTCVMTG